MKPSWKAIFISICITLFTVADVYAQVPMKGWFLAEQTCEAYQSIKKGTNPGHVRLIPQKKYELIAKNKEDATYYRITVMDATPGLRWVKASCGVIFEEDAQVKETQSPAVTPVKTKKFKNNVPQPEYLLAISWQPAFCQTHQAKAECRTQDKGRYDADHFTLHGLWPQPRSNIYCTTNKKNKSQDELKRYDQLPEPDLSRTTYKQLTRVMPGVQSFLHRHEWIKHGTCYDADPETYFQESMMLMKQINRSAVREYFSANIGKTVSVSDIRDKFDQAFGPDAGNKVKVKCRSGMITELWINLKGEITPQSDVALLLKSADTAASKCRSGLVDPVGY